MRIAHALLVLACAASVTCQPDAATHIEAGDSLYHTGKYADAVREYRAAVEADPTDPSRRVKLARALMKARLEIPEAVAEAIRVLKEAIAVDPLFWPARYHLANALRRKGDLAQAVDEYQAALKLNPQDVSIYTALGKTYRDLGRPDEARATFKLGLAVAPTFAALELRFYLAELDAKVAIPPSPPDTQ